MSAPIDTQFAGRTNRVAVIGAGWAGLTAALQLCERGAQVTLFEAAPQVGGRARGLTLKVAGQDYSLDNGQHLLVGAYRDSLTLIHKLGADHKLTRMPMQLNSSSGLAMRTYRLPAPLHLLAGLLFSVGLSRRAKLRMAGMMFHLQWCHWRSEHTSVARLLAHYRQPNELVERLWRPLCIATLNTDIDRACAQTFVNVLRDTLGSNRAASDFMVSRCSLSELFAEPALHKLQTLGCQVRLRTTVRELAHDAPNWRVISEGTPALDADQFDQIVLAIPPINAQRLLQPLAPPVNKSSGKDSATAKFEAVLQALTQFDYEPIATVYLWWEAAQLALLGRTLPPWIQLDEALDRDFFGQWLFDRGVQNDRQIAGVVVSAATRALLSRSTNEGDADRIGAAVARQVSAQLDLPTALYYRTITEKRATFQCTPERPKLQFDALDGVLPGLWLAGDYAWPQYPATLEAAVRSGLAAATACLNQIN